jgi:Ca2+-binding RTX toxin-like protein
MPFSSARLSAFAFVLAFCTFVLLLIGPASSAAGILPMASETSNCQPQLVAGEPVADVKGTQCDDVIVADAATVSISGLGGNDLIIGSPTLQSIEGDAGDDTIYANGAVEVYGGADDDSMYGDALPDPGSKAGATLRQALEPFAKYLPSKALEVAINGASSGGATANLIGTPTGGPDVLIGEQGNDTIDGLGGDDRIYGNIGDDVLFGSDGGDLVAGGHGADELHGNDGNDTVRGDGTVDDLFGGPGTDVVSFASAVTPGFTNALPVDYTGTPYTGFPSSTGERGVYVDLVNQVAYNGLAGDGGGNDVAPFGTVETFEDVVGSPFADYIVGTDSANVIDGGGGSDIIRGLAGDDTLFGQAGGDHIDGGANTNSITGGPGTDYCLNGASYFGCNESGSALATVVPRHDSTKVDVGFVAPQRTGSHPTDYLELYATGGSATDNLTATYTYNASTPDTVKFELSSGSFDTDSSEETADCDYTYANASPKRVTCTFDQILDMVNISGLAGDDDLILSATGFPLGTNVILLGGNGADLLQGSDTGYDMLVDGPGNDVLQGFDKDDGLINNQGTDELYGGVGSDLLLSTTICEGDTIGGGGTSGQVNDASWAQLSDSFPNGVGANLSSGTFGNRSGSGPTCTPSSLVGSLAGITALEGSKFRDGLTGDAGPNTLLGRNAGDWLTGSDGNDIMTGWTKRTDTADADDNDDFSAGSGNDTIYGRDDVGDVAVACGAGNDSAELDLSNVDAFTPSDCDNNVNRD